jgi:proteasome-associated ATPase
MDDPGEPEILRLRRRIAFLEQVEKAHAETREMLDSTTEMNRKLEETLKKARKEIQALRDELIRLTSPPSSYAVILSVNTPEHQETSAHGGLLEPSADIIVAGRKMRVNIDRAIESRSLRPGDPVLLNEAFNIIGKALEERQGEIMTVKELLADSRILVSGEAGVDRVILSSPHLDHIPLSVGDPLMVDVRSGFALEKMPKSEVGQVVLEEIPDVTFDDIGGLDAELEMVRDAVELPFLYPELYAEYHLDPPKGVLLYGPPGCGKTLIAKAVANSVGKRMAERHGKGVGGPEGRSYFLHVKGPELLNKYVGESERQIREVFARAREKAEEGHPVIVFFDEMDSLFRTRGTGVSSDMESTIVPQFLAEIDGVERLRNVIVIGASNRQDLIDPAILRPGRLDVKIRIDRPDEKKAIAIFHRYLTRDVPLAPSVMAGYESVDAAIDSLIDRIVTLMYEHTDENRFMEVTYASGEKEVLYFKDFSSGAMISGIVARAKQTAIKRQISDTGERGLSPEDLTKAIRREFQENEDLPNTTNPDDWARIAGRKNERIVSVKTLSSRETRERPVETLAVGHYL